MTRGCHIGTSLSMWQSTDTFRGCRFRAPRPPAFELFLSVCLLLMRLSSVPLPLWRVPDSLIFSEMQLLISGTLGWNSLTKIFKAPPLEEDLESSEGRFEGLYFIFSQELQMNGCPLPIRCLTISCAP